MKKIMQNDRNTKRRGGCKETKPNGYFYYTYCGSIGGIIALLITYLVFFLKVVVDFLKEASLGLATFYPL
ncbi:MAG: hypothetical protein AYP45_08070 [Candidatus Brocadia carolinensis]|uniref:Uncharacterized protein n=1 Tax=Candidatus Brocadia carolinensis TaxID=1004156 RepID=A0A1V4AU74_9BACT|nr:MAG: hypothetical protein AYP45_08070 [Candidatus Brocadia caroliniensis]